MAYACCGGVGWGGAITFMSTCIPTQCYATDVTLQMLLLALAHVFDATLQMLLLALLHVLDATLQILLLAHVFDATLQMLLLALAHVLDAAHVILILMISFRRWMHLGCDSTALWGRGGGVLGGVITLNKLEWNLRNTEVSKTLGRRSWCYAIEPPCFLEDVLDATRLSFHVSWKRFLMLHT